MECSVLQSTVDYTCVHFHINTNKHNGPSGSKNGLEASVGVKNLSRLTSEARIIRNSGHEVERNRKDPGICIFDNKCQFFGTTAKDDADFFQLCFVYFGKKFRTILVLIFNPLDANRWVGGARCTAYTSNSLGIPCS